MCQHNPLLQKQLEKAHEQVAVQARLMEKNKEAAREQLLRISLYLNRKPR